MHTSYENILKRPADFRVKYRFYTKEEGGRTMTPTQGYRSDFWYESPDHKVNQLFMVRPEFENGDGEIILETDKRVLEEGTARMWIVLPNRSFHKNKIKVGLKCFMMEGLHKVAECEVIEIVGLHSNYSGKM